MGSATRRKLKDDLAAGMRDRLGWGRSSTRAHHAIDLVEHALSEDGARVAVVDSRLGAVPSVLSDPRVTAVGALRLSHAAQVPALTLGGGAVAGLGFGLLHADGATATGALYLLPLELVVPFLLGRLGEPMHGGDLDPPIRPSIFRSAPFQPGKREPAPIGGGVTALGVAHSHHTLEWTGLRHELGTLEPPRWYERDSLETARQPGAALHLESVSRLNEYLRAVSDLALLALGISTERYLDANEALSELSRSGREVLEESVRVHKQLGDRYWLAEDALALLGMLEAKPGEAAELQPAPWLPPLWQPNRFEPAVQVEDWLAASEFVTPETGEGAHRRLAVRREGSEDWMIPISTYGIYDLPEPLQRARALHDLQLWRRLPSGTE